MNHINISEEFFERNEDDDGLIEDIETVPINILIGDVEKDAYNSYDALMIVPHNIYLYGEELNKKIREALKEKISVYILDSRGNINKLICPEKPTLKKK